MTDSRKTPAERIGLVEYRLDNVIEPKLNKVAETLEENSGGLNLARLLDNKITSVFIAGIIAVTIYFLAKGSSGL